MPIQCRGRHRKSRFWKSSATLPARSKRTRRRIAAARDIIKGAPAAAQELTWGADPEAAERGRRHHGGRRPGLRSRARAAPAACLVARSGQAGRHADHAAARDAAAHRLGAGGRGRRPAAATPCRNMSPPRAPPSRRWRPASKTCHGPASRSRARMTNCWPTWAARRARLRSAAGTPETAGERAKTGLTGFIKTESQKPVSEAYKAVDELIDPACGCRWTIPAPWSGRSWPSAPRRAFPAAARRWRRCSMRCKTRAAWTTPAPRACARS